MGLQKDLETRTSPRAWRKPGVQDILVLLHFHLEIQSPNEYTVCASKYSGSSSPLLEVYKVKRFMLASTLFNSPLCNLRESRQHAPRALDAPSLWAANEINQHTFWYRHPVQDENMRPSSLEPWKHLLPQDASRDPRESFLSLNPIRWSPKIPKVLDSKSQNPRMASQTP